MSMDFLEWTIHPRLCSLGNIADPAENELNMHCWCGRYAVPEYSDSADVKMRRNKQRALHESLTPNIPDLVEEFENIEDTPDKQLRLQEIKLQCICV